MAICNSRCKFYDKVQSMVDLGRRAPAPHQYLTPRSPADPGPLTISGSVGPARRRRPACPGFPLVVVPMGVPEAAWTSNDHDNWRNSQMQHQAPANLDPHRLLSSQLPRRSDSRPRSACLGQGHHSRYRYRRRRPGWRAKPRHQPGHCAWLLPLICGQPFRSDTRVITLRAYRHVRVPSSCIWRSANLSPDDAKWTTPGWIVR